MASNAVPEVGAHRNIGLINSAECGVPPLSDRIVGGNRTQLMELPFMALIAYNTRKLKCTNFEFSTMDIDDPKGLEQKFKVGDTILG